MRRLVSLLVLALLSFSARAHQCPIGMVWVAVPLEQATSDEDPGGMCNAYHEPTNSGSYESASCASADYCVAWAAQLEAQGACPTPGDHANASYGNHVCWVYCSGLGGGYRTTAGYTSCQ